MKYAWEEAVRVWLPSVPLHHIQVTFDEYKLFARIFTLSFFIGTLFRKGLHR